MQLLLDTHVVLWWLADDPALSADAKALISQADNDVFVSSASVLEMAIKASLGKLETPDDLLDQLARAGFEELPVDHEDSREVGRLPWHHRDPFDRILVAQARTKRLTIVTGDARIASYEASVYAL